MQGIVDYLAAHSTLSKVLYLVVNVVVVALAAMLVLFLSKKLFQKMRRKETRFNTQFAEKFFRFLVIFLAVMWIVMSSDLTKSFGASLFQSTAVIAAIAGFAAQSVLSDLICGIILSSTKPFQVGDRIEMENGIAGIVKDMTLRHVVLQGLDTQVFIVPNSRVNAQYVRNMSYQNKARSVDFHFSVSYNTDPEQAARIIRQAIMDSPYSVPGKPGGDGGDPEYAQVYFLAFRDSSLDLGTTGYYMPGTPTEVFKNDVNTRVKKALENNHIEIPYNYLNVMVGEKNPK